MFCQCYNKPAKVWVKRDCKTGRIAGSQKEKFEGVPVEGDVPEPIEDSQNNEGEDTGKMATVQGESEKVDIPNEPKNTTFFF